MEYARFLGMDTNADQDLLYIAEEGLRAPVPAPWKIVDANDEIFYQNDETGVVM